MRKSIKILLASIASLLLIPVIQFSMMGLVVVFFVISFIYDGLTVSDPTDIPRKYAPQLNPEPKYFMTIKGHVEKNIPNIMPRIIAIYRTNEEKCTINKNRLSGSSDDLSIDQKIILKINSSGHFEQKVVLDKYLPGKCNWAIRVIKYGIENTTSNNEEVGVLASFDALLAPNLSLKNGKQLSICEPSYCFTKQASGILFGDYILSPHQNYNVIFNIIKDIKND